jgi:hypothetical protein
MFDAIHGILRGFLTLKFRGVPRNFADFVAEQNQATAKKLSTQHIFKGVFFSTASPDASFFFNEPLTLIRMTKDEKGLAFFKGLLL